MKPMKVGELARRTGLSVRTLHHYDEIGLLRPAERTQGGHRLYGHAEVARLQQVLSLRALGLSLDEVRELLARPDVTPGRVIELHRARIDERIERLRGLSERLGRLAGRYEREERVPLDEFLQTIEVIGMTEEYFTPEQLEQLERRRQIVGEDAIRDVENRWADLTTRVNDAMAAGLEPTGEGVKALAREWRDLTRETMQGFTGGDAGLRDSVGRMWTERPEMGTQWGMGPEVQAYMRRAMAALGDER